MSMKASVGGEDESPLKKSANVLGALFAASALSLSPVLSSAVHADVESPPAVQSQEAPFVDEQGFVRYSKFVEKVKSDEIERVLFAADGKTAVVVDNDGNRGIVNLFEDKRLLPTLTEHNVDISVSSTNLGSGQSGSSGIIQSTFVPGLLLLSLFLFLRGRRNPGPPGEGGMPPPGQMPPPNQMMGGQMGRFAQNKAKFQMVPETGVTFKDVAGCDSAKVELAEVVDFLTAAERYTEMGARIPTGVLMEGPPGTGKTLLAKAVAGEAQVPFFSTAGSEFVEMFVGVGASRVRDLFKEAKENAPCIIFIDEIDAIGKQRGSGSAMGGNDEREQTLNQILTEMDGFEKNSGVIVIAATNRADTLDNALTRAGRFDRKVTVDLPDFNGRKDILKVHCRGKPLDDDIDIDMIARRTPGFSGAQLENLMNEAAIMGARREAEAINFDDVDRAIDKLMVGLEKSTGGQSMKLRETVAVHEAGHAVVGALIPDYDLVQKITIVPRSNGAGGLTFFAPSDERTESGMYSKQYLEGQLAVALGGRAAEEVFFGEQAVTTGASGDLDQVNNIARMMVTQWGMSEAVGPVYLADEGDTLEDVLSLDMMRLVDKEMDRIVSNAYKVAKDSVENNLGLMKTVVEALLDRETVSADEFQRMVAEYASGLAPYDPYGETKEDILPFQDIPLVS